jgi:hypothetical protein
VWLKPCIAKLTAVSRSAAVKRVELQPCCHAFDEQAALLRRQAVRSGHDMLTSILRASSRVSNCACGPEKAVQAGK